MAVSSDANRKATELRATIEIDLNLSDDRNSVSLSPVEFCTYTEVRGAARSRHQTDVRQAFFWEIVIPMVFKHRMPRLACSVFALATMLSAAGITGCDSGTNAVITPEQKNRATEIANAEKDAPVANKRTGKKVGGVGKSMTGRMGDAGPD
jgi:hypothetical protein